MLKVFRLIGLSENEIALFASHYGVGDVVAFVDATGGATSWRSPSGPSI
jgi:hypothetical protein